MSRFSGSLSFSFAWQAASAALLISLFFFASLKRTMSSASAAAFCCSFFCHSRAAGRHGGVRRAAGGHAGVQRKARLSVVVIGLWIISTSLMHLLDLGLHLL